MTQLMTSHDPTTLVMTEVMTLSEIDSKQLMFLSNCLACRGLNPRPTKHPANKECKNMRNYKLHVECVHSMTE